MTQGESRFSQVDKDYLDQIGLPEDWIEPDRENRVFQNAMSFNRQCEYLGVSDINPSHVQSVASRLGEGELVVMLPNHAHSMWSPGLMDDARHRTVYNPGRRYIANKCGLLITPRSVHLPGQELGFRNHWLLGELPTITERDIYRKLRPSEGHR